MIIINITNDYNNKKKMLNKDNINDINSDDGNRKHKKVLCFRMDFCIN